MPSSCATANAGRYAVRHNPWTYHLDERADCERYDVPLPALADDVAAGALPDVGMVPKMKERTVLLMPRPNTS